MPNGFMLLEQRPAFSVKYGIAFPFCFESRVRIKNGQNCKLMTEMNGFLSACASTVPLARFNIHLKALLNWGNALSC